MAKLQDPSVTIKLPREKKEQWQQFAESQGFDNLSAMIRRAVTIYMSAVAVRKQNRIK